MENLLKETLEVLESNGKTLNNIKWIGSENGYMDLVYFKKEANKEYYSGYGGAKVAEDLLIVGDDFAMYREEYDGAEWWKFRTISKPEYKFKKANIFVRGWEDLQEKQD